jgi:hypothetical protein
MLQLDNVQLVFRSGCGREIVAATLENGTVTLNAAI